MSTGKEQTMIEIISIGFIPNVFASYHYLHFQIGLLFSLALWNCYFFLPEMTSIMEHFSRRRRTQQGRPQGK